MNLNEMLKDIKTMNYFQTHSVLMIVKQFNWSPAEVARIKKACNIRLLELE